MNQLSAPVVLGEVRWGNEIGIKAPTNRFIRQGCLDCGKERWVALRKGTPISIRCRSCAPQVETRKRKIGLAHKGVKNSRWGGEGGSKITPNGYILIRKRDHPKAGPGGYIWEHIYVWETVNNRTLPNGFVVHHLNGIKNDNRPENLVAMKKNEHLHPAEPFKKRIRALEIKITLLEKALESNQLMFRIGEN